MTTGIRCITATFIASLLWPVAAFADQWSFDVFLDGRKIGEHRFVLEDNDGQRKLASDASFKVKILFINAYSYQHTAREVWQDDCLSSLSARTVEKGETSIVKGKLENNRFAADGLQGKVDTAACAMTFAYWNPKMLSQKKLLNPQTGEWLDVNIAKVGSERIEIRGQQVKADHYKLHAPKLKIDLWYSPDKEWLALKSTTAEGYVIRYKLK